MIATSPKRKKPIASRKERSSELRSHAPVRPRQQETPAPRLLIEDVPAAGAHAARHLVNEDATPGAGVLPSVFRTFGKEVDGAAG